MSYTLCSDVQCCILPKSLIFNRLNTYSWALYEVNVLGSKAISTVTVALIGIIVVIAIAGAVY